MTWQRLLEKDIQDFILEHEKDDVARLALKKPPSFIGDYPLVLDQIKSRQKARKKMPQWLEREDIVFPPSSIIEQASSTATALYKASLINGESFVDLSGGAGVDAWAFLERFKRGIIVERDERAAHILQHNLTCKVISGLAEEYVYDMPHCDLAYIDPQRRDMSRKGKFRFEDCSPDILNILPILLDKARCVMLKASPMLDIWAACEALGSVHAVHIVEWQGECKEILYFLRGDASQAIKDIPITAVSITDSGEAHCSLTFCKSEEDTCEIEYALPQAYFYEPSPAFLKSGGFKVLAQQFGVKKLHEHTHLYTSKEVICDFPGRCFKTVGIYAPRSKDIPLKKAHISVRNFPQTVEILRKKLKISEGGEDYLFATTLMDEKRTVLHGIKL